ncbi:MAG: phage virion morphogenesis protein [Anaerolineales bacterium]|nr:phage virion morphogenesis protein [Anaerolineales bacterium]
MADGEVVLKFTVAPQTIRNTNDLLRFFQRVGNPDANERRTIADAIRRALAGSFANQGSARGAWSPLRPRTVAERIRLGYPGQRPILIRSGQLRASWTQRGHSDHVETYERTRGGWRIGVGSKDIRAGTHERGNPALNIPARPVRYLTGDAERRLQATITGVIRGMEP